jgi:TIR domain
MRVFISFAHKDANVAAKLKGALRRRNIEAWSTLDLRSGEDLSQAVDEASAMADGFVFLLGAGASADPRLLTEWRMMLRNDSESKKALIPVINSQDSPSSELPAFLRNRQALLLTTNYDAVVDRVQHLLEHPNETRDCHLEEEGKVDQAHRLEELKQFALALKDDAAGTAEHR